MKTSHDRDRAAGKNIKLKLATIIKKIDNLLDREYENLDFVNEQRLEEIRRSLHEMMRRYS
jgi:hypothetical protein